MDRAKYPRTPHLPWSPGATSDDKMLDSVEHFLGQDVVITEKLDGENTTMYGDGHTHARSTSSVSHGSRDWIRRLAGEIAFKIPEGWRICGENVYAKHSIAYAALPSYFMVFGVFEGNRALDWDTVTLLCEDLGLSTVPVLYQGVFDPAAVRDIYSGASECGGVSEGYVVRTRESFLISEFDRKVAKFVRQNHVTTNQHWMHGEIVPNQLLEEP